MVLAGAMLILVIYNLIAGIMRGNITIPAVFLLSIIAISVA